MMAQQPIAPQVGDQIYRDDSQISRNDWPQMPALPPQQQLQQPQQQQPVIPQMPKQTNSVWPEKLPKQTDEKIPSHKKVGQPKDSEYSDEYSDADESQSSDGEDSTTTEAPKKVKQTTKINESKSLF